MDMFALGRDQSFNAGMLQLFLFPLLYQTLRPVNANYANHDKDHCHLLVPPASALGRRQSLFWGALIQRWINRSKISAKRT